MAKTTVKVTIEERLSKTVEIEVETDGKESITEIDEKAVKKAIEEYNCGNITLSADDFYYKEIGTENSDFIPF